MERNEKEIIEVMNRIRTYLNRLYIRKVLSDKDMTRLADLLDDLDNKI